MPTASLTIFLAYGYPQELVPENAWVHIAVVNDAEEVVQLRDRLRQKVKLVK